MLAGGATDLVNVGPPPATDLVNVAWGGDRLSPCCPGGGDRLSQCRRVGPADIVNAAAFPESNHMRQDRKDRETCFLFVRCLPLRLTDTIGDGFWEQVFPASTVPIQ